MISKEKFKNEIEKFLLNHPSNSEQEISAIDFNTNLWDSGLVDSFRIMELILFLEDLLNQEVSIENNFITNFHTVDKMYNSLVLNPV